MWYNFFWFMPQTDSPTENIIPKEKYHSWGCLRFACELVKSYPTKLDSPPPPPPPPPKPLLLLLLLCCCFGIFFFIPSVKQNIVCVYCHDCFFVYWLVASRSSNMSRTDPLRHFYILPHWDRSCRSIFLSHPVTVYCHRANQSQPWPKNTRCLTG